MPSTPTLLAALPRQSAPEPRPAAEPAWSLDADRWACATRLMDGLTHDLRNPLNALSLNVEVLSEKLARAAGGEALAPPTKNLQALRNQVVRLDSLLAQFSRFLAPPAALPEGVMLGAVVREVSTVVGHAVRKARTTFEVDVPDEDPLQPPDPALFRFLLLRSVLRAIDRTPPGGRVRLSLAREGGRPVLVIEDGAPSREPTDASLDAGLTGLARSQGADLQLAGSQLRLALPA